VSYKIHLIVNVKNFLVAATANVETFNVIMNAEKFMRS